MAAAVTVADALVAFPFAYYMARIASPRTRTALFVAILLPLWASYLAKVYSWLLIFTQGGVLDSVLNVHLIYTNWAVFIVFCYLWLPFMIIPVYAALERIPASLIEASQDLGGRTWRTTRSVLLPLALPGIVAGSIFTFSLTLGRLHHAAAGRRDQRELHRQHHLLQHRDREQRAVRRRHGAWCRSRSWPSTCSARGRSARSRRSEGDGISLAARGAAGLGRAGAGVPVHPDRAHRAVRVQPVEHRELADRGLLAALVRRGLARPAGAQRVPAVGPGRAGGDRAGPAARLRRGVRAAQVQRSSAGRRSRSCWCCRWRCPASSPGSR